DAWPIVLCGGNRKWVLLVFGASVRSSLSVDGLAISAMVTGQPAIRCFQAVLANAFVLLVPPIAIGFFCGNVCIRSRSILALEVKLPGALPNIHWHVDRCECCTDIV